MNYIKILHALRMNLFNSELKFKAKNIYLKTTSFVSKFVVLNWIPCRYRSIFVVS